MITASATDILRFALTRLDNGIATALVTLVGIEGSSPRALGAQMAVAVNGDYVGSFSGGCIEAAVVAEAIASIGDGLPRQVRFGKGSPFIDIRLPCGGGIDLLFAPMPAQAALEVILSRHERRELSTLCLSDGELFAQRDDERDCSTGWRDGAFLVSYPPAMRLLALGQGEELVALARLSDAFGVDVHALSPDARALNQLAEAGIEATRLVARTEKLFQTDAWTAILFLFHDRDWEEYLLPKALDAPAFFIGAIGSPQTQRARLTKLSDEGVGTVARNRLRTAVGIIPSTRDPATLALSILAQLAEEYQLVPTTIEKSDNVDEQINRCDEPVHGRPR